MVDRKLILLFELYSGRGHGDDFNIMANDNGIFTDFHTKVSHKIILIGDKCPLHRWKMMIPLNARIEFPIFFHASIQAISQFCTSTLNNLFNFGMMNKRILVWIWTRVSGQHSALMYNVHFERHQFFETKRI